MPIDPVTIASQWGSDFDARLRDARPDVAVVSLPRRLEVPLPPSAAVLLAVPFTPADRVLAAPPGWPFGLRWTQLISVGIDNYPRWLLEAPLVSTARGSAARAMADFVLACVLRHALRLPERRATSAAQ